MKSGVILTAAGLAGIAVLVGQISAGGGRAGGGPTNDNCAAHVTILEGVTGFSTIGANTDGPAHVSCEFDGQTYHDIWYDFTAPQDGLLTVSTCNQADYDTDLVIYNGCDCLNLSLLGCNDDTGGCAGFTSEVRGLVIAGNCYLIRVGGWQSGDQGSGTITVSVAEPPPPPSIGPDVIVGAVPSVHHWGSVGTIHSYSIATTSCNIGDTDLLWIANTNQHPVIAQNMFRLTNGRFEQIGQSWLKHAFTAINDGICGACNGNLGSVLGVGCSDPYGAGLNGSQSLLGPKSEVNAATGFYPYPYVIGWQQTGNTIYKRLQVQEADLANPSALYFVEGHYVTADDAAWGNQNNNASYRSVTIDAGSLNASVTGSTHQQDPAIQAWQDQDPSVGLGNIDVANDGRFILGYKATDNGDGTWHYEYALLNLNSDRSGQSFSVPIPACVTVTNEGFHDVFYHSGEPYDGADWPVTVGGGDVSWSTDDFTFNPNANALRWGTMYNYRFDADSPPTSVTVEIGLFKPGTPVSVTAGAVGPTARTLSPDITGPLSVPDGCVDAFDLGAMLAAWCSAVNDPNPPSPPCENCNPANLCLVDISGAGNAPDGCVDAFDLAKLLAEWCSVAGGNPCGTCF